MNHAKRKSLISKSIQQFSKAINHFWLGWEHLWTHTFALFTNHIFIALTIVGNTFVLLNAAIFYFLEIGKNKDLDSYLDAVWWAIATVTTVGYGDITPITDWGKFHGILLMLSGTAIFLTFTALFAKSLIGKELEDVESQVKKLKKSINQMSKELEDLDQK